MLQCIDIGDPTYAGIIDPDAAFWALARKDRLGDIFSGGRGGRTLQKYLRKRASFLREMERLRFGNNPTAVYFNPTERCNLNCKYCYIPEPMRRRGVEMSREKLFQALAILKKHFQATLPKGVRPQIIFHGSEPLLAREAVFAAIERYRCDFRFGVQTNGTLLDDAAVKFLTARDIGVGLSLDGASGAIAGRTRVTWNGHSVFAQAVEAVKKLRGYPNYNVICTVTRQNMHALNSLVDFLHELEVPVCMLNPVRCTEPRARGLKPADHELAPRYIEALERTYALYKKTGRKLIVANFANILLSILAPTSRRLMCDISPCGGGRCFFAVSARGGLFPCSEFIGLPEFNGGNLFKGELKKALAGEAFKKVTGRKVEDISPCARCAVRHFCGSPCPAEAYAMNGGMERPGAFCELYEEQARYALRLIASGRVGAFLWKGWDKGTQTTLMI
jgi:uncharacterized protein